MTQDDIVRMSQEAGPLVSTPFDVWRDRFAALVAAHERKACAYECEVRDGTFALKNAGKFFADIIRARGEA